MSANEIIEEVEQHVVDSPILVRVTNEPSIQEAAADKASLVTYQLKGDGSTQGQRLLALQPARHKAQIIVYGTAGDYVIIGRSNQRSNGQGGRIYTNSGPIPVESKSDLYVTAYTSAGQDIFVTVIEELYTR